MIKINLLLLYLGDATIVHNDRFIANLISTSIQIRIQENEKLHLNNESGPYCITG